MPCMQLTGHHICCSEHLNSDSGVTPEDYWLWPQNQTQEAFLGYLSKLSVHIYIYHFMLSFDFTIEQKLFKMLFLG